MGCNKSSMLKFDDCFTTLPFQFGHFAFAYNTLASMVCCEFCRVFCKWKDLLQSFSKYIVPQIFLNLLRIHQAIVPKDILLGTLEITWYLKGFCVISSDNSLYNYWYITCSTIIVQYFKCFFGLCNALDNTGELSEWLIIHWDCINAHLSSVKPSYYWWQSNTNDSMNTILQGLCFIVCLQSAVKCNSHRYES